MAKGQIKQAQARIDRDEFEKLCAMQCTTEEIAGFFGCCKDTLFEWGRNEYGRDFSTVFAEKKASGRSSLRRSQWKKATEKNDTTMLIWLGKQYLGQTDKIEQENVERVIFTDDIKPDGNL